MPHSAVCLGSSLGFETRPMWQLSQTDTQTDVRINGVTWFSSHINQSVVRLVLRGKRVWSSSMFVGRSDEIRSAPPSSAQAAGVWLAAVADVNESLVWTDSFQWFNRTDSQAFVNHSTQCCVRWILNHKQGHNIVSQVRNKHNHSA